LLSAGLVLISLLGLLFYRNNRHKQKLQGEKIRNLRGTSIYIELGISAITQNKAET